MGVVVSSQRLLLWSSLMILTVHAGSCAVFPDEAVLPASNGGDPSGGGGSDAQAGATGDAGGPGGGATDSGGVGGAAGAGVGGGGSGSVVGPSAGAAGEGGAGVANCDDPQQTVVTVTEDTWIGAAKASVNHGLDKQLFVDGGADERRTLLRVEVPEAAAGAWLTKATLVLNLESNEDAMLVERQLGLHRLTKEFVGSKATWINFTNGQNEWTAPGGDYGAILAEATLRAGMSSGSLSFDVTKALRSVYSAQAVPLGLIIRESGAPPVAAAALAFTSAEGDASDPSLVIDFCLP